jgi:LemA protein
MTALHLLWLVVAFVAAVYGFAVYNHLVALKHNVAKAWANVDVLLRQRNDELPKLIAACAPYMRHEQALLERIAADRAAIASARERADTAALGGLERQLHGDLARLGGLAESYPQLKASDTFVALQARIAELESAIADRREFFNATVAVNNVEIGRFPNLVFARAFGLRALEPFGRRGRGGPARPSSSRGPR